MKKVLLLATALFAACSIFAQSNSIPNPGFENWTSVSFQDPINCQSSNDQNVHNSQPVNVFRITDAYHAKYAVQMKTVKFGVDTIAAYFAMGNPGGGGGPSGGSPISGAATGVRVYYKYTVKAADTAILIFEFKKAGAIIGQYFYQIYDTTSTYTLFSQTFSPALSQTPDTVIIAAASSSKVISSKNGGSGWAPGSIFQIDSLTLTGIPTQPKDFDGDFENWQNDTIFNLVGWSSGNNGNQTTPLRTTDARAGKYAVELITYNSNCNSCTNPVSYQEVSSGKLNQGGGNQTGGLPYTLTKDTLEFFYKYVGTNNPNDTANVELVFHGFGGNQSVFEIYLDTAAHYKKVDYPFTIGTFTPDSVIVNLYSSFCKSCFNSGGLPSSDVGSDFKVDSMRFKSQLALSVTPPNPTFCAGTGGISITAKGATSYTWSPSSGLNVTTGATVTANPFSTQTYTVTGTSGGTVGTQTVVVTVNFPPTVTITPSAPSICSGNSVNLTASGASVSYTWAPSTNLTATTGNKVSANPATTQVYTVTGISASGCSGSNTVSVNVTTTPTVSVKSAAVTICSGSNAQMQASGATTYNWKPANGLSSTTGATVTTTTTVTTTYTVVGYNGTCADSTTVVATADSPIKVTMTSTNVSCNGMCNGTATPAVSGGTIGYAYSWSTIPVQTGSLVTSLCPGPYTVTVTDGLGCNATGTVSITQPAALSVNVTPVPTTCGQADGEGIANVTGGTTPYGYAWNSSPVQTTQTASGLAAGTYKVIITDANKCLDSASATLATSSAPVATVKITPSNCGTHNGIATANVTGGVSPYKYSWNTGKTTATIDSLAAGVYILTVTDKNGCSSFQAVTIGDTNGPSLSVTSITQNKCYGQSLGAISVSTSGGKTPYHYSWSNGATTTTITALPAGPYQVTVIDATGCTDVKSINITAPPAIALTTSSTQASCKTSNGSASVIASGGTSPYGYTWSTAATTTNVTAIPAGTYSVMVIDNNGCKDSANASVSNASGPVVKITSVVSDSCTAKGNSGSIDISDSGGSTPYTYSWSNGATTSNITALGSGSYAVTVTDASGCLGTANTTVAQVPPPAISICMVTVNPANNQNQVIWNKSFTKRIASYNIYKETTAPGVFNKIGSVKADSSCIYNDTLSNALVRSWRYEISQVDSCGNESPLSLPHKTMHLTISPGTNNNFNLIWDNYQGLSFGYYIVYRDSVVGVAGDSINYVTNNGTYTFSDKPWTVAHNWYYHMGISNPGGCTPAIEAVNYNASKSNTGNFTVSGIASVDAEVNSFEVYPNPSTGTINLNLALASVRQNINVKVINTMGQVLLTNKYDDVSGSLKKQIDLSAYSKGVYIVQVTTGNSVMFRKVVIQ